jgi:hypothetical protein
VFVSGIKKERGSCDPLPLPGFHLIPHHHHTQIPFFMDYTCLIKKAMGVPIQQTSKNGLLKIMRNF